MSFLEELQMLVREKADELGSLDRAKLLAIEGIKAITEGTEGCSLAAGGEFRCVCGLSHYEGPVSGHGSMYWCPVCQVYRFIEHQTLLKEHQTPCADRSDRAPVGGRATSADVEGGER